MCHARRKLFQTIVLVLMLSFPAAALLAQAITVVSWGGSYARASQEGYHKPSMISSTWNALRVGAACVVRRP